MNSGGGYNRAAWGAWAEPYSRPRHNRTDVSLRSVFRNGDALYEVVSIADQPTVQLRNVATGECEHHVISSLNFAQYEHLRSEGGAA